MSRIPPESNRKAVLVPWSGTRLFVPLAPPSAEPPADRAAALGPSAGDGLPPSSDSSTPDGRPPEWVYEMYSRQLSAAALLDLYVALRELAKPVRLEMQEEVLRREILRRMGVELG